jgi:hypothetical protein
MPYQCPQCSKIQETEVFVCPSCGQPMAHKPSRFRLAKGCAIEILVAIIVLTVTASANLAFPIGQTPPNPDPRESPIATPDNPQDRSQDWALAVSGSLSPGPPATPTHTAVRASLSPSATATSTASAASPIMMVVINTNGFGAYIGASRNPIERGKLWPDWTPMAVIGPDLAADGITWKSVRDPDDSVGWMQAEYLLPPHLVPPTGTPTATSTATQTPTLTPTPTRTPPATATALAATAVPVITPLVAATAASPTVLRSPSPAAGGVVPGVPSAAVPNTAPPATPTGARTACPPCCVKGDITERGELVYHIPGGALYNSVVIGDRPGERWFCSELDAQAAGWRKSAR